MNQLLKAKANNEIEWINKVDTHSSGNFAVIGWSADEIKDDKLLELLRGLTMKKIAFICVHNSCRSQIAEALGKLFAGDVFESYSAGTETKPQINQDAVRLVKELYGIDMEKTQHSKLLSEIPPVDVVITMGCNVTCPYLPCQFHENWGLDDPTGKIDEEFIKTIRTIEDKVKQLAIKLK